jgi:hypothetical protein
MINSECDLDEVDVAEAPVIVTNTDDGNKESNNDKK